MIYTVSGKNTKLFLSKKKKDQDEDVVASGNVYFGNTMAQQHEFYLCGEIGPPSNYIEWFNIIRNAGANDVVLIHINSVGGDGSTAIQFLRVMEECQANIVVSVEGDCMSAATMVFLKGDVYQISEHSQFMFHTFSTGMAGKSSELHDGITAAKAWGDHLIRTEYKGFLTEDEILAITNGKDLFMTADLVAKRLEARVKAEEKKAEERKAKAESKKKVDKPSKKAPDDPPVINP